MDHRNPVWTGYFADPFVLKWNGHYFAYGTGNGPADGRAFPVLHSCDLFHWEPLGGALALAPELSDHAFWAPEVAERDGLFYLYYSTAPPGSDEKHRLRVAVAGHPDGPFEDSGRVLLPDEGFAIDAHPFRDPADGRWYLLYARDFFDARPGTAIAGVPLADDMLSVAGSPVPLLRASSDWQIYERNRRHYGRTWEAWHTLEGPALVAHEGRYYLLYSGGNWQTPNYGVGCAVADSVLGPYTELEAGPVVLQGDRDHLVGPGHNSVVRGPDGRTDFIVYHAWDADRTARRMHVDPLVWTPAGPRTYPPSLA